jgi:arabinan endo-1,5-alpha-L-arabinosidase
MNADRRRLPIRVGALKGSASNRFYVRHGFVKQLRTEFEVVYLRLPRRSPNPATSRLRSHGVPCVGFVARLFDAPRNWAVIASGGLCWSRFPWCPVGHCILSTTRFGKHAKRGKTGNHCYLIEMTTGPPSSAPAIEPLLTQPLSPQIRYGYGDPAVLRIGSPQCGCAATYYLLVTSNDAPDAFPILRSPDLRRWEQVGFVFPKGHKPAWTLDGEGRGDYWAPELHRVGNEYIVVFSARSKDGGELAIGVARSATPLGPFVADKQPLLEHGVIDPHLLVEPDGSTYLFWKRDSNDRWPSLLAELLHRHPEATAALLPDLAGQQTASLCRELWPSLQTRLPMERFLALQPLIAAVTFDLPAFQRRLGKLAHTEPLMAFLQTCHDILEAMRTPIHGQRLAPGYRSLVGPREIVLTNDRPWEAHLVEGAWVARHGGVYYLFYAGNDFTTADYGIGVALSYAPLGPYAKLDGPLLTSTPEWSGPGHPSVAIGLDGQPQLFLHAFFPGQTGYKKFRALLTVPIAFEAGGVMLRQKPRL